MIEHERLENLVKPPETEPNLPLPPVEPKPNRRHQITRDMFQFVFFVVRIGLDLTMVTLGFLLAYWLRSKIRLGNDFLPLSPPSQLLILGLSCSAVLLAFQNRGLYQLKRGYSKIDEFYRICAGVVFGLIVAIALNSMALGSGFFYSRQILIYAAVLITGLVTFSRLVFGSFIGGLRKRGAAQVRLIIVGTGETTQRILRKVHAAPDLGYKVLGVVCEKTAPTVHTCTWPGLPPGGSEYVLLGHLNELTEVVRHHQPDEVIVAMGGASQEQLLDVVALCDDLPVSVKIYPDAFQLITTNEVSISELTGLPLVSVKDVGLRGINRVMKRTLDLVISLLVLVLLSAPMLFVAVLIKLTDPRGPVFYTQIRVGLDGRPFTILKFRSMRNNAEAGGPGWTTKSDPRRTLIGSFIRRFSIDELPQFINVLLGDMSIVGPRPEQPKFVEQFSQTIPRYMRRHQEKAGITGWAQVNGLRGDTSIAERTRYDLYYIENWSVLFDLKIMLKSIIVVFTDKNAY
ncbi:MAG: undecaprenyl-phosphate glucose phosphotransferase [Chloroflexota bacterium]